MAASVGGASMAGRSLKTKVQSNVGAAYVQRFFDTLWTNRLGQLSTSAVQLPQDTSTTQGNAGRRSASDDNKTTSSSSSSLSMPVHSDLQPYALHKFSADKNWSLVVTVPRSSVHYSNVRSCATISFMVGHTDPQMFHWFKQLGSVPPRALITGVADVLHGDLQAEVWQETLVRHPVLHSMAQEAWEADESHDDADKQRIMQRQREEDEKRMRRMSSSDWRTKFRDRERNPTAKEDEEMPVYVMKPDNFAVLRLRADTRLWFGVTGKSQRVWETTMPDADPLYRCAPRFITMLNSSRAKLVAALNINYELRLTNAFIFAIDQAGMWALGTEDNVAGRNGVVDEAWSELRIEFGKDQRIRTEQEMEWWIRGLTRLGVPEVSQVDNSSCDAANHMHHEYRHS